MSMKTAEVAISFFLMKRPQGREREPVELFMSTAVGALEAQSLGRHQNEKAARERVGTRGTVHEHCCWGFGGRVIGKAQK